MEPFRRLLKPDAFRRSICFYLFSVLWTSLSRRQTAPWIMRWTLPSWKSRNSFLIIRVLRLFLKLCHSSLDEANQLHYKRDKQPCVLKKKGASPPFSVRNIVFFTVLLGVLSTPKWFQIFSEISKRTMPYPFYAIPHVNDPTDSIPFDLRCRITGVDCCDKRPQNEEN